MEKTIFFPATVEAVNTRKDRTVAIKFGTQELPPGKMTDIFTLQNMMCILAVKATDFSKEEEEAIEGAEIDLLDSGSKKTASQRQRAVLFLNWKQDSGGFDKFSDYYSYEMERIITHYKSKLKQ